MRSNKIVRRQKHSIPMVRPKKNTLKQFLVLISENKQKPETNKSQQKQHHNRKKLSGTKLRK